MAGKLKGPINMKDVPPAGSQRNVDKGTPSSDPSKASTPANLRSTFGVPKNE